LRLLIEFLPVGCQNCAVPLTCSDDQRQQ
jgi:hypothetical protein